MSALANPASPRDLGDDTEALQRYLEARESLFTTSRTISVSEMAMALAHEINQPVGTIANLLRGARARLERPDPPVEDIIEALDRALEQAQFTRSVIDRIRDFTRARQPQREAIDLSEVLLESVQLMDWLLGAAECRVDTELPTTALSITGDRVMLQQVLVNLLRNAVEAMQQTPKHQRCIRILGHRDEQHVYLDIEDAGHGLTGGGGKPFVPFASAKPGGMGVGLSICRSFVELHRGRLWLGDRSADGDEAAGGCVAHIQLPRRVSTGAVDDGADSA